MWHYEEISYILSNIVVRNRYQFIEAIPTYITFVVCAVFCIRHTLIRFDQLLNNKIINIVHHEDSPVTHQPTTGVPPKYILPSRVNVFCLFVWFRDVRFVFVCQTNYTKKKNSKAKTTRARRHRDTVPTSISSRIERWRNPFSGYLRWYLPNTYT